MLRKQFRQLRLFNYYNTTQKVTFNDKRNRLLI